MEMAITLFVVMQIEIVIVAYLIDRLRGKDTDKDTTKRIERLESHVNELLDEIYGYWPDDK